MSAALHNSSSPRRQGVRRYQAWLLVALTVLFVLIVRVRLRDMPLERDEGEYAYAGQLMLHGLAPYKEAYTMKLPGTYAAYAVIMALFGQSPAGIHVGLALVNAASIVLVFLLGRRLLDEAAGVAAAVAFALLSLSPSVLGLAAHATHFVVLAALGGILLLLRACELAERDQRSEIRGQRPVASGQVAFFLSGLLFGLAFLMKQHGLFFGLCGAIYLLWTRTRSWLANELEESPLSSTSPAARRSSSVPSSPTRLKPELRRLLRDAGLFLLGGLAPYGLTCLVLWAMGALQSFVFWTITYAAKYASAIAFATGADILRASVKTVIGPNIVLWILPLVGALVMWWEERLDASRQPSLDRTFNAIGSSLASKDAAPLASSATRHSSFAHARFFVVTFLLCSLASVSVGFYFREHYFILLLPALALLTGIAVSRGLHLLRNDTTIELFLALAILGLYAIGVGAALIGNGPVWLGMSPAEAMRSVCGTTLFSEAARAADYIRNHSPPGARIAVLGSEPEIYFYARRRAATGHLYLYMYPLMEPHSFALKMQQDMIAEIERTRPEFLVYVDDPYSWLQRPDSERRILEWWQDYWGKHLDLVQTIEFEEGFARGTDTPNLIRRPSTTAVSQQNILILQRRR